MSFGVPSSQGIDTQMAAHSNTARFCASYTSLTFASRGGERAYIRYPRINAAMEPCL